MLRFALHRQGQNSQVSTRCHGMPCRGPMRYCQTVSGLVIAQQVRTLSPSTDRRKGFLPALNDRVSTLGVR
jgi:hypothetical protein